MIITTNKLPWHKQHHHHFDTRPGHGGYVTSPLMIKIQKLFSKEAKAVFRVGDYFPVPTSSAQEYNIVKKSYYKVIFNEGRIPSSSWFEGLVSHSGGLVADVFHESSWKHPGRRIAEGPSKELLAMMQQYIDSYVEFEKENS